MMRIGRIQVATAILACSLLLGAAVNGAAAQQAQPSADLLRIERDGAGLSYAVWLSWSPYIVTMPDGGAWVFFSAEALRGEDGQVSSAAGQRGRLYAARFDPATGAWSPARAMPGGQIQFGPAAVVTGDGTVHLVFTDRAQDSPDAFGQLVYTRSDGQGGWSRPAPVAPNENAGHQIAASAELDQNGQLHVVWQDQRNIDAALRAESAAYADVFASDLSGSAWSAPVQLNKRPSPDVNASRPHLVADGDRLVAVWSVYQGVDDAALASATMVEWSTRPLADAAAWAEPQTLIEKGTTQIGGRLLDLATDPRGGAAFVYGRRTPEANSTDVFLLRLDTGATSWGAELRIASGNRGGFPSLAVGPDGMAAAVYNVGSGGSGSTIHVGVTTVPPGATQPNPEVILTLGEEGAQGRAVVAIDASGKAWVVYAHEPPGSRLAIEMRALRNARLTQ